MAESVLQRCARKIVEGEKRNPYDFWIRQRSSIAYTTVVNGFAADVVRSVEVDDQEARVTVDVNQFGERHAIQFTVKKA